MFALQLQIWRLLFRGCWRGFAAPLVAPLANVYRTPQYGVRRFADLRVSSLELIVWVQTIQQAIAGTATPKDPYAVCHPSLAFSEVARDHNGNAASQGQIAPRLGRFANR